MHVGRSQKKATEKGRRAAQGRRKERGLRKVRVQGRRWGVTRGLERRALSSESRG